MNKQNEKSTARRHKGVGARNFMEALKMNGTSAKRVIETGANTGFFSFVNNTFFKEIRFGYFFKNRHPRKDERKG